MRGPIVGRCSAPRDFLLRPPVTGHQSKVTILPHPNMPQALSALLWVPVDIANQVLTLR